MTARELFEGLIAPETVDIGMEESLLAVAEAMVLNRMYPFGYDVETAEVPARYVHVQAKIAVELYSKQGAEGEKSHVVGDVERVWETGDVSESLLRQIIPCASGVIRT